MRYVKNLTEKLNKKETLVCACDDCDKYRAVDLEKDKIKREYIKDFYGENHGEWINHYKCICGCLFHII
jgi:hypothetical protein